jgi:C1A family cysteine protease
MSEKDGLSFGWIPDLPDFRDYTVKTDTLNERAKDAKQEDSIKLMLEKVGVSELRSDLPDSQLKLRKWCSPIENQLDLNSCTAHAGVGILEYFENRAFGRYIDASRLFLYKTTRNMLHLTADVGAYLRTTMGAMRLFGVCPEEYWPYITANVNVEPSAFCYSFAQNFQAIQYYRLDPPEISSEDLLKRIKTNLAAGLPSMFGFTVFTSIYQAKLTGRIPYPASVDSIAGGHAVVAVGYDDSIEIKNDAPESEPTKGALLIRNSYGSTWGPMEGYLWLPYKYVKKNLAVDWWSLLRNEWVDTEKFKIS